ncbi:hypothetical protein HAX54_002701 [Datura stramonium]|uniref:Uncharacterized protein n=1 Tax=Datura stramonium TaxID=4076 RepID=A0ABS8RTM5_DATST|nr:hypothetical protein [Datura stramonium]
MLMTKKTDLLNSIIDLNCLSSSTTSDKDREQELEKLRAALSSWGCFQGIGHGISVSFLDKIRQVSRNYFKQPMEEKNKYAKTVVDFQGYGADPVPEQGQYLDWSDRLFLDVFPEDQRQYNLWPQLPVSFREVLEDYAEKIGWSQKLPLKLWQVKYKLEENCFLERIWRTSTTASKRPDLVLGLKPHADGTGYTIILQDEVGLQWCHNWPDRARHVNPSCVIPPKIMSNGIFKGTVHRVLSNSERDRISVAVFYLHAEVGKEIGPEDGLVNGDRPKIYKRVKDYAETHWKFYQRGMRALHTVQI